MSSRLANPLSLFGAIAIVSALLAAAGSLYILTLHRPKLGLLSPSDAQILSPLIGGGILALQREPGFHLLSGTLEGTKERFALVQNALVSTTPAVTVNLCHQLSQSSKAPQQIIPIRFFSTEARFSSESGMRRQALVGGGAAFQRAPDFIISGTVASLSATSSTLNVGNLTTASVKTGALPLLGRGSETWVLWDAQTARGLAVSTTAQQIASPNNGGNTAVKAAGFANALRLRHVALGGCEYGAIEAIGYGLPMAVSDPLGKIATPINTPAGEALDRLPSDRASAAPALRGGDSESLCSAEATLAASCRNSAEFLTLGVWRSASAPRSLRLAAGTYPVSATQPGLREDRDLFDAAVREGVLKVGHNGLLDLYPIDAAQTVGQSDVKFSVTDATKALHKRLYRWASGDEVRAAVRLFNQSQRSAAVRLFGDAELVTSAESLKFWRASLLDMPQPLSATLPDTAMRYVSEAQPGWTGWRRVASWPSHVAPDTAVEFSLLTGPTQVGKPARLRVIGSLQAAFGATITGRKGVCTAPACKSLTDIDDVELTLTAATLRLTVLPNNILTPRNSRPTAEQPIYLVDGQLRWEDGAPARNYTQNPAADVSLLSGAGRVLFSEGKPTALAQSLGLEALVGLGAAHSNSVAGALSRLPQERVEGQLSIDDTWQENAFAAITCVGHRSGKLNSAGQCNAAVDVPHRRSAVVLLDADNGEIVAAASGERTAFTGNPAEWVAIDRYHPAKSALQWTPWQHDGGPRFSPGSTFKVIDALGLESIAKANPFVNTLLAGDTPARINTNATSQRLQFNMANPCYPGACGGSSAQVENYRDHRASDYLNSAGQFGVKEALAFSLNTWFAFTAEATDAAAQQGLADVRPLSLAANTSLRPITAMAQRLGVGEAFLLDGGLLSSAFPWNSSDLLRATPSALDPIDSAADVRRRALGLRMQLTPLQMSVVAAAVATGQTVSPHVLRRLDQRLAQVKREPLEVRTDRITEGMRQAVTEGTARAAFSDPMFKKINAVVFGKTGTAPHADGIHNNAWFIGWIDPNPALLERRRLAFAVLVSNTEAGETGGVRAAAVIAAMLKQRELAATALMKAPKR
jgi:hypothetical protein